MLKIYGHVQKFCKNNDRCNKCTQKYEKDNSNNLETLENEEKSTKLLSENETEIYYKVNINRYKQRNK